MKQLYEKKGRFLFKNKIKNELKYRHNVEFRCVTKQLALVVITFVLNELCRFVEPQSVSKTIIKIRKNTKQ